MKFSVKKPMIKMDGSWRDGSFSEWAVKRA